MTVSPPKGARPPNNYPAVYLFDSRICNAVDSKCCWSVDKLVRLPPHTHTLPPSIYLPLSTHIRGRDSMSKVGRLDVHEVGGYSLNRR